MDSEQNNDVECPTCRGLGKVSSNDPVFKQNEQYADNTLVLQDSKAFLQVGDKDIGNIASETNNLKLLTEMDTIIGCVTDLLPEKVPLENPKEVIKSIVIRMKNNNSEENKRAIFDAVQVARNHQDLLKPHLNLVNIKITQFLNSQRVLYVRLACQAAGELFRTMRCTDRPIFDNIVHGLMYRTADKNQNVRIDANWALDKMVISVPALFAIRTIANCHHKNPAVKIAQFRLMHCVTVIAEPMKILTGVGLKETRQLILRNCITALEDGNADIRFMSKKLLKLFKNTCYESFSSALVQDISWDELKVAEKLLQMEETDEIFDTVIRYGLYFVAVFQLVCITTVFLLTDHSNDSKDNGDGSEYDSDGSTFASPRRPYSHHRSRKQDKKKRR